MNEPQCLYRIERLAGGNPHIAAVDLLCALLWENGLIEHGEAVVVKHRPSGQPFVEEHPDWSVSISHCREAVAVAVGTGGCRVGIDVEARRWVNEGLIERVCTAEEREWIGQMADQQMAFLQLWTQKEAVLKMRGTGIKGFGSLKAALKERGSSVREVASGIGDVVAALAVEEG